MEDALDAAAIQAAADIEDGLEDMILLAGDHPHHYLHPTWGLREFDLAGGGEPAKPPQIYR